MIKLDTVLKVGKSHKICEDYIIKGYDPFPYIILSDGCSSSDDADIGARILCHLAKQYLTHYEFTVDDMQKMGDWVIYNAEMTIRHLGLRKSCLDATLIVALAVDGGFQIYVFGDGSVITIKKGRYVIYNYEYSNNTPFYLSYQIDPMRREAFDSLGGQFIHTVINSDAEPLAMEMPPDTRASKWWWASDLDLMLVCSDGISSFLDPENNTMLSVESLIESFTSFKNTNGEFLKRRLLSRRGAISQLENNGVHHIDDLSIGAMLRE